MYHEYFSICSVWDKTWSPIEHIPNQPQKLLTFQTVFTIFMIYQLRSATAAPPSYLTSLASVEGQDIFNVSCHLLFSSGWKWGRWGIFASWQWHVKCYCCNKQPFCMTIQFWNHHGMINTRLCSHMVKNGSFPMSSAIIHVLWWSSSSSKTHCFSDSFSFCCNMQSQLMFRCVFWKPRPQPAEQYWNQRWKPCDFVPALLKRLIRGWRPLKCNLGLLFHWSSLLDCTDELLVP